MLCEIFLIDIQSDIHREGVCAIIRNQYADHTIHIVSKGQKFIDMFRDHPSALCLLSTTSMEPEVCSLIEKLDDINPHNKIILMIPATHTERIERALKIGVNGLFTQYCSSVEFLKILSDVGSGKNSYSRAISDVMMKNYRRRQLPHSTIRKQITKRESEVLSLIVKGYTSAEIAKQLFISPRTVETHRCNLMGKLKLKNTAALVRFALQEKNIEIN